VIAVAFQIVFHAEMHANDVFLFFKNHFWHQHIKTIQKVQTALNFNKKKIQNLMKRNYKRNAKQTHVLAWFTRSSKHFKMLNN
jgi:G:T-mismatch repair DNA endonuclease (very short patch repair protein)